MFEARETERGRVRKREKSKKTVTIGLLTAALYCSGHVTITALEAWKRKNLVTTFK